MSRAAIDGILVEWGARLFYPPNRIVKPRRDGRAGALAALARRRPPTAGQVRAKIHQHLSRTPQVVVRITGSGRGMRDISRNFRYVSREGTLPLESERGEIFDGPPALRELRDDWRYGGSEIPTDSDRREAFNIVLSMPRTVSGEDVVAAAREFAKVEFANHSYVFVLHEPDTDNKSDRPHVHLVVRVEDHDGRRLNPRKADLQRWRERFADALGERGVPALATRRETRGETRRSYSLWEAHGAKVAEARGVTDYEIERQKNTLRAWREIATALARSDDVADRNTAIEIARFVSEMPATRLVAANADRLHNGQTRELIERQRAGFRER